ncbi:MAG: PSP1 domain-containing protein [Anaerovoracaceae bacterium]|jgi:cell fate regulator YaaT (PSP1 superfamily)
MVNVVGVKFKSAGKIYYFDAEGLEVSLGDHVIVETARGIEFGTVGMEKKDVEKKDVVQPLKKIIRAATEEDEARYVEIDKKKERAMNLCQEKIEKHQLEMKLIDVEHTFDNSKIIFYFTADGRVDFRNLVKDLAGIFRMRIELRQIGVRDEAKMLGGIGNCGKGLCCHQWLSEFHPVSIKMAKVQNLSLNPTKISGVCGRLMCCLKYENDVYVEMKKGLPDVGERVTIDEGPAIVWDTVILEGKVKCRLIVEEGDREKGIDQKLSTELYVHNKEDVKRSESRRRKGGQKKRSSRGEKVSEEAKEPVKD